MLARYEGEVGKRKLAEVFAEQEIVQHSDTIARKLAAIAIVEEFKEGKQLYLRGEPGRNVLFFVLSGSVDLSVQDKHVATLEAGQVVGEFPIVDPSLNYTVTVLVREQSDVASVSEEQFLSIANEHPEIWKYMAKALVTRLRNANKSKQQSSASGAVRPGDLTVGDLWRGLTVPQLWGIIVTIISALAAVATVSYKVGTGVW